jgi:hypothetical protein
VVCFSLLIHRLAGGNSIMSSLSPGLMLTISALSTGASVATSLVLVGGVYLTLYAPAGAPDFRSPLRSVVRTVEREKLPSAPTGELMRNSGAFGSGVNWIIPPLTG